MTKLALVVAVSLLCTYAFMLGYMKGYVDGGLYDLTTMLKDLRGNGEA